MRKPTFIIVALILFSFGNLFAQGLKDRLGIGLQANSQKLYGDSYTGTFEYGVNPLFLRLNVKPSFFIDAEAGYSKTRVASGGALLETDILNGGLKLGYRMFSQARVTPLLFVGLGAFSYEGSSGNRIYDGYGALGGGLEFLVNRFLGINMTADYRMTTNDNLDGANLAGAKDSFLNVSFGFNYYMGSGRLNYTKDIAYDMLGDYSAVEQVGELEDEIIPASEMSPADYANYALKKEQLMHAIVKSESEIKLLKAKVNVLKEHSDELEDRIKMAGLMGNESNVDQKKNKYLIHYRNAIVLFQAQYYDNAIITLQTLIEEKPFHPLTASAWYWIGESRFNLEKYQEAAAAFRRASLMSKSSLKSEISQLMVGLCLMKSGDDTAARINFEKLLQVSSNASCSELVREYLDDLTSLN